MKQKPFMSYIFQTKSICVHGKRAIYCKLQLVLLWRGLEELLKFFPLWSGLSMSVYK